MANNGVDVLPKQASGSMVDAPTGYLELFADLATGKMSSIDENGSVTKYGTETVPQDNVYYVGKHGSNSNSGRNLGDAVLTIAYAISLAVAQSPSASNGFVINILDGGIYAESFLIPSYVFVDAPGAVVSGNVTCEGFAGLNCNSIQATSGVVFKKMTDSGTGSLRTNLVNAPVPGVNAIECAVGDLVLDVFIIQVNTGIGVLNSGNPSSIHGTVGKLTVSGAGTALKSTTGSGNETAILLTELTGASATGVDVDIGHIHLVVGEFNVGTGGDVAAGTILTMFAADLYGATFTGSGTIKVTEAGVTALHGAASHTGSIGTHAQLTSVTADQHHPQAHAHNGADGSGTVAHSAVTGKTTDDHHPQSHSHASHTGIGVNDHHAQLHATSHKSGGGDAIKLDELAAPTDITTLDATTSAHGLLKKLGGGTTNFLRADGSWAIPPGAGGSFGANFQQGNSDGESSTTSGTFQQKLRVTTPSLPSGTYRIGFYYEWHKSGLTDFVSRVQVNDTTDIMSGFEEAPDAGTDQWFVRGGFGYYTGSGVLNIDLDYHAGGSDTARIRRARLEIWRVA